MARKQSLAFFMGAVLTAISGVALAQADKSAGEMVSLLDMRFYDDSGGFLIDKLVLAFPPEGDTPVVAAFTDSKGGEVETVPLRVEKMSDFPVFATMRPSGRPGFVKIGKTGKFKLGIRVGDQVVTELPFSVTEKKEGDEFNPKLTYTLDGPWSKLAYIGTNQEKPDRSVRFAHWTCLRQARGKLPRRAKLSIALMKGKKVIATGRADKVVSTLNWNRFTHELVIPNSKGQPFTEAALTKKNGNYVLAVNFDGKTVASYPVKIAKQAIVALPRTEMTHKPRTDILVPRMIDMSSGSGSSWKLTQVHWLEAR